MRPMAAMLNPSAAISSAPRARWWRPARLAPRCPPRWAWRNRSTPRFYIADNCSGPDPRNGSSTKPRWDAFYATALEQHLRALNIDTLVVCGCNLPNCPRATLFGASNRDFRTILVRDATSRVTPERLADLALMGTEVMGVDETARFDAR